MIILLKVWPRVSLIAQLVKNPLAMQETQVQFLDQEDPLEKEMAAHSRILVWSILWTEEPGGLQSMGSQESDTTEPVSVHHSSAGKESTCNARDPVSILGSGRSTGEGMGYPLQYSWASLVAQTVKNPPAVLERSFFVCV